MGDLPTLNLDSDGIGRVDRYELLEKLGQGGFGAVYGAKDTEAGILVALKALPAEVSHDAEEMALIRSNFALVSRLHHPNIASVLHLHRVENPDGRAAKALGVQAGDYLVVMEYAPGATLFKWRLAMPGGKMPLAQVLPIARRIADALDYSHSQKVLHRDVKPKNIMINVLTAKHANDCENEETDNPSPMTDNGTFGACTVKVLDFGLAAEIRSSMSRKSKEQKQSTSGTPNYMAPEQWQGVRQGPATDQYALAVVVYELLGGEVPFKSAFDTGNIEIMRAVVLTEPVQPLPELTKQQNAVLLRALAKEPEERFGSCGEFVKALAGGRGQRSAIRGQRSPQKTQKGTKKWVAGLLGVGLLGAYMFISTGILNDKKTEDAVDEVADALDDRRLSEESLAVDAPPVFSDGLMDDPNQGHLYCDGVRQQPSPLKRLEPADGGESHFVAQDKDSLHVDLEIVGGRTVLTEGESVQYRLRSNMDCYVALLCRQSDGSVIVLFPNAWHRDAFIAAGMDILIPDGSSGFEIIVSPPFGEDIVELIASTGRNELHTVLSAKALSSRDSSPFLTDHRYGLEEVITRGLTLVTNKKQAKGWYRTSLSIMTTE